MQELDGDQLAEVASILVTLMIFYSIDAKYRFSRNDTVAKGLFRVLSMAGGIAVGLATLLVWAQMFLPQEHQLPPLAYFIPATFALLSAFALAFEVIVLRIRGEANDETEQEES